MKRALEIAALAVLLVPSIKVDALVTKATGDCEQKRELCMDSCRKQHQDCDNKGNDSSYCAKQDEQCSNGCENAWRRCSEKQSSSELELDSSKRYPLGR